MKALVNTKINCPFCDEESKPTRAKNALYTPQKNYIYRECIMGHYFWSVEYVPEYQDEIEDEIKEIRGLCHSDQRNQKEKVGMEVKAESIQRKNINLMNN